VTKMANLQLYSSDEESTRDTLPPKHRRHRTPANTSDSEDRPGRYHQCSHHTLTPNNHLTIIHRYKKQTHSSEPENQCRYVCPQADREADNPIDISSDSGSSDSDDPVSRKARKLAQRMREALLPQPESAVIDATGTSANSENERSEESMAEAAPQSDPAENPFAYAMLHGHFPTPAKTTQQQRPEPLGLTEEGILWNAVPPRYSQYLDMEAAHGSSTSSGSTGSSDGSLSDDFIEKDDPQALYTGNELQYLAKYFPKTFKRKPSKAK
jgi:hypothetical protein